LENADKALARELEIAHAFRLRFAERAGSVPVIVIDPVGRDDGSSSIHSLLAVHENPAAAFILQDPAKAGMANANRRTR